MESVVLIVPRNDAEYAVKLKRDFIEAGFSSTIVRSLDSVAGGSSRYLNYDLAVLTLPVPRTTDEDEREKIMRAITYLKKFQSRSPLLGVVDNSSNLRDLNDSKRFYANLEALVNYASRAAVLLTATKLINETDS